MTHLPRAVRACAALAAVSLLPCLVGAAAFAGPAPASPRFTPGAAGVGDAYFPHEGNGGYDVRHYALRLSYDPATRHLAGTNTITAVAHQNLSRFDLDLRGLRVDHVRVDGAPATFTRTGPELVVTPAAGLVQGRRFRVTVAYGGTPRTITGSPLVGGASYGWIYTKDGAFVGGEPDAARTWFPANDQPRDKASFHFDVSVPRGTEVVANGTYGGHRVTGDTDTFTWDERRPMPTYLATVGIGRWRFHRTTTPAGIPELTAVDPVLAKQAGRQHVAAMSGRITDYWAKLFGRYPFDSTGAIVDHVPDVGFSLETVTRPLYGFVPDDDLAAHELAHEWFGDSVSVRSWRDIWLNEGFATFASWLWDEHYYHYSTWHQARDAYHSFGRRDSLWRQAIARPGRDDMFSAAVYLRGSLTLAALRHKIGDKPFFTLLRVWTKRHRYGNASTADFTRLAQRVSGQPLHHFFHVWLWRKAKPGRL